MAMTAVLKVDVGIAARKLDSFKGKRQTLIKVMQRIREVMIALATVSWISPSSAALLQKFLQFYKQIEEALRIVEEYIHDLEVVIEQYTKIEDRLKEKASALRTDIFGV
jgi:DNA repair ATPase RecN